MRRLILEYRRVLIGNGAKPEAFPRDQALSADWGSLSRNDALAKLDNIKNMLDQEMMEGLEGELGFVRGVLWINGLYSQDELRAHVAKRPK